MEVVNVKPKAFSVSGVKAKVFSENTKSKILSLDVKPKTFFANTSKPKMVSATGKIEVYGKTPIFYKGSPMGLLLTLTYPETFSFMEVRK